jgi:hypothetical protein
MRIANPKKLRDMKRNTDQQFKEVEDDDPFEELKKGDRNRINELIKWTRWGTWALWAIAAMLSLFFFRDAVTAIINIFSL